MPSEVTTAKPAPAKVPPPPSMPYAVPVDEAGRLFCFSRTAVYNLLAAGLVEGRKHGLRTLVLTDSMKRYVDSLPKAEIGPGQRQRGRSRLE